VGNAYDLAEKFTYTDPFTNERRTWFSQLWNQVRETEARGFAGLAPLFGVVERKVQPKTTLYYCYRIYFVKPFPGKYFSLYLHFEV
jgi:hypothetical protein